MSIALSKPDNFRTEKLTFDVADFVTTYNMILGSLMLGRFMAVVHYVYQVFKITFPNGVITIKSNKQILNMVEHFCRIATTSIRAESK